MQDAKISMRGKTCLVTGTTSGIGRETALALAEKGATVLTVVRDRAKGEAVAAEAEQRAMPGSIKVLTGNLSLLRDVREVAARVLSETDRLDVLINNAGVAKFERLTTAEGNELMLATNYLAPFLLTNLLLGLLKSTGSSRIVNLGSGIHALVREIPWDDLQAERKFDGFTHYAVTKLMDIMFTYELARRLEGTSVTANAVHPGHLNTKLSREAKGMFALFLLLSRPWMVSPRTGALPSLYLATSPEVAGVTGKYFVKTKQKPSSKLSLDEEQARRLWDMSAELCGLSERTPTRSIKS